MLKNILKVAQYLENKETNDLSERFKKPLYLIQAALKEVESGNPMCADDEVSRFTNEIRNTILPVSDSENSEKSYSRDEKIKLAEKVRDLARLYAFGSSKDSHLDDYGLDMVFAPTVGSVNMTLKRYIDTFAAETLTLYYMEETDPTKHDPCRPATPEEVAALEPLKLFEITMKDNLDDYSEEEQEKLNKAFDLGLYCAFTATAGFPDNINMKDISIINFNPGETGNHTKVKYNLYSKEFEIIEMVVKRSGKYQFNHFSQKNDKNPWVFSFNADLGMIGVTNDKLPYNVAQLLNNIDPESIFSISQLYLDLNESTLLDTPEIVGNISTEATRCLEANFIGMYFNRLKREEDGGPVLGYALKDSVNSNTKNYLMHPKDFRFFIQNYDGECDDSLKGKIDTLDYRVICEEGTNNKFPELRKFPWNWVEKDEYDKFSGIMCLSKDRFFEFLKNEISDFIYHYCFKVTVDMSVNLTEFKLSTSIGKMDSKDIKVNWNKSADGLKYSWNYSSEDEDDDYIVFPPIWGNFKTKYNMSIDLFLKEDSEGKPYFNIIMKNSIFFHINVEGGVSEGNILDEESDYKLYINVDESGKLLYKYNMNEKSNDPSFDYSGWSKFITLGTIDNCVESLKDTYVSFYQNDKKYWDRNMMEKYNGSTDYYIPGDTSMTFKDPSWSKNFDLTIKATYTDPS